jgi:hypothetical protein
MCVVGDHRPRRRADGEDDPGRPEGDGAPAETLDEQAQRHLRNQRADVPHHQPEPRHHRKALARKPVRRELQRHDPANRIGAADNQPPDRRQRVAAGRAEQTHTGRGHQRSANQQPTGAPRIDQHAGRNLHRDVGVEVHR